MGSPSVSVETITLDPLDVRASVRTLDDEARSVEVTFSAGGTVERFDYRRGERYLETLSLDPKHVRLTRLNAGAPLLDTHDSYGGVRSMLGAVVAGSASIAGAKDARATVRFSKRADVDGVWQDVRDGIISQVSVGYRVHKFEETRKDATTLPVRTAVDWEPYEISLVPMAADAGAKVRADENTGHACLLVRSAETGDSTMSDAVPAPVVTPEPVTEQRADPAGVVTAAVAAERTRASEIHALVGKARLEASVAHDFVARGVSVAEARSAVLDLLVARDAETLTAPAVSAQFGEDARDKWIRGATNWLLQRTGVAGLVAKHEGTTADKLDAGEFRGMSLMDLAKESLTRAGQSIRGIDKMTLAGQAMAYRSNYQTTSDFSTLLENTMHKVLRAAYGITPDTWSRFCATGTVSDFRTHNWYRTGALTELDALNEHGEFKNKAIPDGEKATYSVTTKGNIIAISRQTIVNDDMGAVVQMTQRLGRAGKLTIEKMVYALLAQNSGLGPTYGSAPLFDDTAHSNVSTGAALAAAALDLDRVKMAQQRDVNSQEYLDLRPSILLVPVSLGGQARIINTSQYDPDTVANKSQMKPNVVAGLFRDIVDTPRISGTRRYLFADPSIAPVLMVSFLEGQQEPVLETQDGWRTDGVEMKARLDVGVDAVDYRGAVTNAGA